MLVQRAGAAEHNRCSGGQHKAKGSYRPYRRLSPPSPRAMQAGSTCKAVNARSMYTGVLVCRPASTILQCNKLHMQPAPPKHSHCLMHSLLSPLSYPLQVTKISPDLSACTIMPTPLTAVELPAGQCGTAKDMACTVRHMLCCSAPC